MRIWLGLLLGLLWASLAMGQAQDRTVLVADNVEVTTDRALIATGNVEVFQGSVSLSAQEIRYDPDGEILTLTGPLVLRDGEDTVILASSAELNRSLRTGILRSARMVLDQQLQLAAVQINRVDARYSQLYKTAVTSCRVCNDDRPPLWQIRARRVVHDIEERQLYFDGAQLRVLDMPILYVPRLRLPDPTLSRATGFLIPSIRSTSQLGTGIEIPYFIRLGDHRDLTLTPYLSANTRTLQARYRQQFLNGNVAFNGAITRDSLRSGQDRWYLFGDGMFEIGRGYTLTFNIERTSDTAYLAQYSFSGKDRLDSEIALSRTRRDEFIRAGLIGFETLRAGEDNSTLPTIVTDVSYERRLFPGPSGGELRLNLAAHSHYRSSDSPVPGEGRDVLRLHGGMHWLQSWTLMGGLRAEGRFGLVFDAFETRQDTDFSGSVARLFPQSALALRYPLSRTSDDGTVQFLEPIAQLSWTDNNPAPVANDESTRVEFDEGNLFALSRFPESDRREHAAIMALGLNWARYDPDGWESYVSVGQILRDKDRTEFSDSSGLRGTTSDYLVAAQLRTQSGLALAGRFLFDGDLDFSKGEVRGDWSGQDLTLGGSYLWLEQDTQEDRFKSVSELTVDGNYRLAKHWSVSGNWRYDAEDDRTARAGLGLAYANECVSVNMSVQRSFTSSTSVEPQTKFGFTVGLRGFSTNSGPERQIRSCSSPAS